MRLCLAILSLGIISCASQRGAELGADAARPLLALKGEQLGVAAATISAVIASLPSETTTVCVTLNGPPQATWYTPDAALREAVALRSRRIVGPNECPPTYQNMFVLVDSAGRPQRRERPAGYIDPYDLIVREPIVVVGDSSVVLIDVHQGTRNHYYRCVSYRTGRADPTTRCEKTGTSVSALPDEAPQPGSTRSAGVVTVSVDRDASASERVRRILSRPLIAELRR